jgi:putative GTP pyrophosphokinase
VRRPGDARSRRTTGPRLSLRGSAERLTHAGSEADRDERLGIDERIGCRLHTHLYAAPGSDEGEDGRVNDSGSGVVDDWEDRYRADLPIWESYRRRLVDLVSDLIQGAGIDTIQVESRTKSVESLAEKVGRKGDKYSDPLEDITDLVGIRVITYYAEDVTAVGSLVRRELDCVEELSAYQEAPAEPDQFGYVSDHYIVTVGDRGRLTEWSRFAGRRAEIQVRSALQHAWASVSHKLDYKSTEEVPPQLRRRLFRLSAMFELADEQLSELRRARTDTEEKYELEVERGRLDIPIGSSSLAAYWSLSPRYRQLRARLRKTSTILVEEPGDEVDAQRLQRDRRDLVKACKTLGIRSLGELDSALAGLVADPNHRSWRVLDFPDWLNVLGIDDAVNRLLYCNAKVEEGTFTEIYSEGLWEQFRAAYE